SLLRELSARSVRHERASRVQTPGLGDEFLSLREYSPGDTPRQIAWRASARRAGQNHHDLLVRQNAAGATPTAVIVLDLSGAPDEPAYELAISQAAGIAHAALAPVSGRSSQRHRLGLYIAQSGQFIPPGTGPGRLIAILDALALLPSFSETPASPSRSAPPPGAARTIVIVTPVALPRVEAVGHTPGGRP
ncbi:MAG: DUF58 domain-containing protein, partial [Phycisphaerales bacterium]